MTYTISLVESGVIRLAISGALDARTAVDLRSTLHRLLSRRPPYVDVDLAGVHMIDTIGVGTLIGFYKRLTAKAGVVTFSNVRDQPLLIFKVLGLDRLFVAYGAAAH